MQLVCVCTLCQRHLECVIFAVVCTHLPCSPEILGLRLIVTLHMFTGPFSGVAQHLAARNLGKYYAEREGGQNGSIKPNLSHICWAVQSSL